MTRDPAQAVLAGQRHAAREALRERGLEAHAARLLGAGRDAIALRVRSVRVADLQIGATRLAGAPDLPPGTGWPVREGYAFDFVGQFHLPDLEPFDVHGHPSAGAAPSSPATTSRRVPSGS